MGVARRGLDQGPMSKNTGSMQAAKGKKQWKWSKLDRDEVGDILVFFGQVWTPKSPSNFESNICFTTRVHKSDEEVLGVVI